MQEAALAETTKEVVTRRKEQSIIEQTKNSQIDQNKLIEKKDILIPKIEENLKIKDDILKIQRDAMTKLSETQPGYIHFVDASTLPDPNIYEPDDDDIEFLRKFFPKEFKTNSGSPGQIFSNQIFIDFGKIIEYIENTRDFSFSKMKLSGSKFSADILEKVVEYWRVRTARFKRPLLRKYWKTNIKKPEFGELDALKVAFRDREKEHMRLRKILKLSPQEIFEKLEELREEAKISAKMSRLIIKREQLKLFSFQQSLTKEEASIVVSTLRPDFLGQCSEEVDKADSIIKRYIAEPVVVEPQRQPEVVLPPAVVEPVIRVPKPVDNDVACFISSLIFELNLYGFDLGDFKCENIKVLNEKIRKIKKSSQSTNSLERVISFLPKPVKVVLPEIETFDLFKRYSNSANGGVFLEKVERGGEKTTNHFSFEARNFTADHLIKRNLDSFETGLSHFRVSPNLGLNPFVYCGSNNYSTNNEFLEKTKVRKYNKMLSVLDCSEEVYPQSTPAAAGDAALLTNIAEQELRSMKLELRFKMFQSNKRIR